MRRIPTAHRGRSATTAASPVVAAQINCNRNNSSSVNMNSTSNSNSNSNYVGPVTASRPQSAVLAAAASQHSTTMVASLRHFCHSALSLQHTASPPAFSSSLAKRDQQQQQQQQSPTALFILDSTAFGMPSVALEEFAGWSAVPEAARGHLRSPLDSPPLDFSAKDITFSEGDLLLSSDTLKEVIAVGTELLGAIRREEEEGKSVVGGSVNALEAALATTAALLERRNAADAVAAAATGSNTHVGRTTNDSTDGGGGIPTSSAAAAGTAEARPADRAPAAPAAAAATPTAFPSRADITHEDDVSAGFDVERSSKSSEEGGDCVQSEKSIASIPALHSLLDRHIDTLTEATRQWRLYEKLCGAMGAADGGRRGGGGKSRGTAPSSDGANNGGIGGGGSGLESDAAALRLSLLHDADDATSVHALLSSAEGGAVGAAEDTAAPSQKMRADKSVSSNDSVIDGDPFVGSSSRGSTAEWRGSGPPKGSHEYFYLRQHMALTRRCPQVLADHRWLWLDALEAYVALFCCSSKTTTNNTTTTNTMVPLPITFAKLIRICSVALPAPPRITLPSEIKEKEHHHSQQQQQNQQQQKTSSSSSFVYSVDAAARAQRWAAEEKADEATAKAALVRLRRVVASLDHGLSLTHNNSSNGSRHGGIGEGSSGGEEVVTTNTKLNDSDEKFLLRGAAEAAEASAESNNTFVRNFDTAGLLWQAQRERKGTAGAGVRGATGATTLTAEQPSENSQLSGAAIPSYAEEALAAMLREHMSGYAYVNPNSRNRTHKGDGVGVELGAEASAAGSVGKKRRVSPVVTRGGSQRPQFSVKMNEVRHTYVTQRHAVAQQNFHAWARSLPCRCPQTVAPSLSTPSASSSHSSTTFAAFRTASQKPPPPCPFVPLSQLLAPPKTCEAIERSMAALEFDVHVATATETATPTSSEFAARNDNCANSVAPAAAAAATDERFVVNSDGTVCVSARAFAQSQSANFVPAAPHGGAAVASPTVCPSEQIGGRGEGEEAQRFVSWAALLPIDWWASPEDRCLRLLHEYCLRWEGASRALSAAEATLAEATAVVLAAEAANNNAMTNARSDDDDASGKKKKPSTYEEGAGAKGFFGAETVACYSTVTTVTSGGESSAGGVDGDGSSGDSGASRQYATEEPLMGPSDLRKRYEAIGTPSPALLGVHQLRDSSSASDPTAAIAAVAVRRRINDLLRLRVTRGLLLSVSEAAFALGSAKLGRIVLQSRLFGGRLLLPPHPSSPPQAPSESEIPSSSSPPAVILWHDRNVLEYLDTLEWAVSTSSLTQQTRNNNVGNKKARPHFSHHSSSAAADANNEGDASASPTDLSLSAIAASTVKTRQRFPAVVRLAAVALGSRRQHQAIAAFVAEQQLFVGLDTPEALATTPYAHILLFPTNNSANNSGNGCYEGGKEEEGGGGGGVHRCTPSFSTTPSAADLTTSTTSSASDLSRISPSSSSCVNSSSSSSSFSVQLYDTLGAAQTLFHLTTCGFIATAIAGCASFYTNGLERRVADALAASEAAEAVAAAAAEIVSAFDEWGEGEAVGVAGNAIEALARADNSFVLSASSTIAGSGSGGGGKHNKKKHGSGAGRSNQREGVAGAADGSSGSGGAAGAALNQLIEACEALLAAGSRAGGGGGGGGGNNNSGSGGSGNNDNSGASVGGQRKLSDVMMMMGQPSAVVTNDMSSESPPQASSSAPATHHTTSTATTCSSFLASVARLRGLSCCLGNAVAVLRAAHKTLLDELRSSTLDDGADGCWPPAYRKGLQEEQQQKRGSTNNNNRSGRAGGGVNASGGGNERPYGFVDGSFVPPMRKDGGQNDDVGLRIIVSAASALSGNAYNNYNSNINGSSSNRSSGNAAAQTAIAGEGSGGTSSRATTAEECDDGPLRSATQAATPTPTTGAHPTAPSAASHSPASSACDSASGSGAAAVPPPFSFWRVPLRIVSDAAAFDLNAGAVAALTCLRASGHWAPAARLSACWYHPPTSAPSSSGSEGEGRSAAAIGLLADSAREVLSFQHKSCNNSVSSLPDESSTAQQCTHLVKDTTGVAPRCPVLESAVAEASARRHADDGGSANAAAVCALLGLPRLRLSSSSFSVKGGGGGGGGEGGGGGGGGSSSSSRSHFSSDSTAPPTPSSPQWGGLSADGQMTVASIMLHEESYAWVPPPVVRGLRRWFAHRRTDTAPRSPSTRAAGHNNGKFSDNGGGRGTTMAIDTPLFSDGAVANGGGGGGEPFKRRLHHQQFRSDRSSDNDYNNADARGNRGGAGGHHHHERFGGGSRVGAAMGSSAVFDEISAAALGGGAAMTASAAEANSVAFAAERSSSALGHHRNNRHRAAGQWDGQQQQRDNHFSPHHHQRELSEINGGGDYDGNRQPVHEAFRGNQNHRRSSQQQQQSTVEGYNNENGQQRTYASQRHHSTQQQRQQRQQQHQQDLSYSRQSRGAATDDYDSMNAYAERRRWRAKNNEMFQNGVPEAQRGAEHVMKRNADDNRGEPRGRSRSRGNMGQSH